MFGFGLAGKASWLILRPEHARRPGNDVWYALVRGARGSCDAAIVGGCAVSHTVGWSGAGVWWSGCWARRRGSGTGGCGGSCHVGDSANTLGLSRAEPNKYAKRTYQASV